MDTHSPPTFIKADNDKIININHIKWAKKLDDCIAVCTRSGGCDDRTYWGTHKICRFNTQSVESYDILAKHFE